MIRSNSGYILKLEAIGFTDGLDMGSERKRFALSFWKNGIANNFEGKIVGRRGLGSNMRN